MLTLRTLNGMLYSWGGGAQLTCPLDMFIAQIYVAPRHWNNRVNGCPINLFWWCLDPGNHQDSKWG